MTRQASRATVKVFFIIIGGGLLMLIANGAIETAAWSSIGTTIFLCSFLDWSLDWFVVGQWGKGRAIVGGR